jgi:hypothetical protein
MTGLSLDKAGGHFILRRQRRDGTRGSISLTPNELLTLAEMAPPFLDGAAGKEIG